MSEFHGAKAAVFIKERLLVYLRDDRADLPWANHWDFPGGGREGDETPEETLAREIDEEFGLTYGPHAVRWKRSFPAINRPHETVWFFVLALPGAAQDLIRFGKEGQRWALMTWGAFEALPNVVPSFGPRMAVWRAETGGVFAD